MAAALCRPSVIPRVLCGPFGIGESQFASSASMRACSPGYCDEHHVVGRLCGSGNRMSEEIATAVRELSIRGYDGVQRVMNRDVHHGVRANALKGKELILGKCNLIDSPVPRHDQRRI